MPVYAYKYMKDLLDANCHWSWKEMVENLTLIEIWAKGLPGYDRHYPGVILVSQTTMYTY